MTGKRLLFILPTLIFLAAAIAFFIGLDKERKPSELPSQLLDKAAPQFTLAGVKGLSVPGFSTADLTSDKVTLVNFFASWCGPCRYEHPLLTELAALPTVRVLGIAYNDKPEKTKAFLDELGNPYAMVGADTQGRTALDFGITGVPETFVIDRQGVIRFRYVGPLNEVDIEKILLPLIAELGK